MRNRYVHTQPWLALAAVVLTAAPAVAQRKGKAPLTWRGEQHELAVLPEELSDGARAAVETWGAWAVERGYRLDLNEDGRVLLVHDMKKRVLANRRKRIAETTRLVDELLPAPVRADEAAQPTRPPKAATGGDAWTWEDDGPPLDTETAVLLQVKSQSDYASVVDKAAQGNEYLAGWVDGAKTLPGFLLERPLCAAWSEDAPGQEEWNIENELVHRLAQLLLLRRFGQMPFWLSMGVAWHVESEIQDGIYCFPYRDGFVWASEHGDWDRDLKQAFKKTKSLGFDELASWKRGSYEPDKARTAWGAVAFLARHRPHALGPILEDLRLLRDEKGIVHHGNSWERIPGFEVSAEDQLAVFRTHAGDDFLDELLRFFQKGKRYKPGKK